MTKVFGDTLLTHFLSSYIIQLYHIAPHPVSCLTTANDIFIGGLARRIAIAIVGESITPV